MLGAGRVSVSDVLGGSWELAQVGPGPQGDGAGVPMEEGFCLWTRAPGTRTGPSETQRLSLPQAGGLPTAQAPGLSGESRALMTFYFFLSL